ncbi:hypothetical protein ACVSQB_41110, partial [Bradyrhizobium elkanii]
RLAEQRTRRAYAMESRRLTASACRLQRFESPAVCIPPLRFGRCPQEHYKEGKGTPEPLLLVRHAGLGGIDDLCRETLALTKMDWNNDGPYDSLPVTLNFAGTLATIVKRMPKLQPHSYPVRLFM